MRSIYQQVANRYQQNNLHIEVKSYIQLYKNVNVVTFSNLKRRYIRLRLLFYAKKQFWTWFTYLLMKVTVILLLHTMTYQAGLRQSYCVLLFLRQLLIFCEKILFVDIGASESQLLIEDQRIKKQLLSWRKCMGYKEQWYWHTTFKQTG